MLFSRLLRDLLDSRVVPGVTLDEAASLLHAHPTHLVRAFTHRFGLPPHRYLLTRRIERAKTLLRDTDLPIIEIAFETGWNSLGTFGRVFRDITGESPGELRAREKSAAHELERVPHCFVAAAHRPNLTIAVSEKRRLESDDNWTAANEREVP